MLRGEKHDQLSRTSYGNKEQSPALVEVKLRTSGSCFFAEADQYEGRREEGQDRHKRRTGKEKDMDDTERMMVVVVVVSVCVHASVCVWWPVLPCLLRGG